MRGVICGLVCVCLVASMFASCTVVSGDNMAAEVAEPITLTLMLPQTHYKDFFQDALRQFEREYPQYRIDVQRIPDNQWVDLVKMKAVVKETPDIIRIDKALLIEVGVENFVQFDESAPWYNRVIPEQRENKQVDGTLYGLPINAGSSLGIIFNKRIFAEHSIETPRSWNAFLEVCRALQAQGVTPLYASDKDSWTTQVAFGATAPQAVAVTLWDDIQSNHRKWAEVPEFAEVLDTMAQLRYDGFTNADYLDATYASAVVEIAEENAAMYMMGEFFIHDVLQVNPDIELSMMAIPYEGDILTMVDGPGQLSIFNNSNNIEAAQLFLDWFSQPDNMDKMTSGWSCTAVFKDQNQQMTEWQVTLDTEYISKGKTVLELAAMIEGVDFYDFWNYQQEMFAGNLTALQVLQRWDISYAQQMQEQGREGW